MSIMGGFMLVPSEEDRPLEKRLKVVAGEA